MQEMLVSIPSTVAPVTSPRSPIVSPARLYQTPNTLGLGRCAVCSYVFPAGHSYFECLLCLNSTCNTKSCSPRRHKIEHEMSILSVKQEPPTPHSPFSCTVCATQVQSTYFCDECGYCICRDCWRREEAVKSHEHKAYTVKEALNLPISTHVKSHDREKEVEMPMTPPETPFEELEETESPLLKAAHMEASSPLSSEDAQKQSPPISEATKSEESSRTVDDNDESVHIPNEQTVVMESGTSAIVEPKDSKDQNVAYEETSNLSTEDKVEQTAPLLDAVQVVEPSAVVHTDTESPIQSTDEIMSQSRPASDYGQAKATSNQTDIAERTDNVEDKISVLTLSQEPSRAPEEKECVPRAKTIEQSYPEVVIGSRSPLTPPKSPSEHRFTSRDEDEETLTEYEAFELYSPGYFGAFGSDKRSPVASEESNLRSSLTPPPLQPKPIQRKPLYASFVAPSSPVSQNSTMFPTSTMTPLSAASSVSAATSRSAVTPVADHPIKSAPIPMSGPLSMSPPPVSAPPSSSLPQISPTSSTASAGPTSHVPQTKRASTMPNTQFARMQALVGTQQLYSPTSIRQIEQANTLPHRSSYSTPNHSFASAQTPVGILPGAGTGPWQPSPQTTAFNQPLDYHQMSNQPSVGMPPIRPTNMPHRFSTGSINPATVPHTQTFRGQSPPGQMPQSTLTPNSWNPNARGQSRGLSNFKNKGGKIKIPTKFLKNKKFWKGALVGTKLVLKVTNIALNQTIGVDLGDAIDGVFDGVLGGGDTGVDSIAVEDLGVDGLGEGDEIDEVVVEDESGEEVYVETDVQDSAGITYMTDTTVVQDAFGDTYVDQEVVATDAYGETYTTETTMATDAYGETYTTDTTTATDAYGDVYTTDTTTATDAYGDVYTTDTTTATDAYGDVYTTETTMATDAYGDVYTTETTMATDSYGDSYMTENTMISDPSTGTYMSESSVYENSPYGSYMAGGFVAQNVTYGGY